jgi:hypothetical protein
MIFPIIFLIELPYTTQSMIESLGFAIATIITMVVLFVPKIIQLEKTGDSNMSVSIRSVTRVVRRMSLLSKSIQPEDLSIQPDGGALENQVVGGNEMGKKEIGPEDIKVVENKIQKYYDDMKQLKAKIIACERALDLLYMGHSGESLPASASVSASASRQTSEKSKVKKDFVSPVSNGLRKQSIYPPPVYGSSLVPVMENNTSNHLQPNSHHNDESEA